jgi:hypothetical protein
MADWWQGGGESGSPSEADLRAAGFQWTGGDSGSWQTPPGWVRNTNATMGYAPPPVTPPTVGFRPTTEALQQLTTVAPASVARFVETGEGGYTTYDYYDPASQAKAILAQPEKVTPEYIKQNFTGFERLPAATLQAMANDWRNAYAQLMKISAPEKLPEGYAQAVSRVEQSKPFISFGGPTEIFQEAAPYVTYDPQYGLIVPQQGIQPYKEKFGIMNLVPSLMLGAALGPMAGALGGGIVGAAGAGAITGALGSAFNKGNILKGALTGGITAGLGAAASPAVTKAIEAAGLSGAAADAVKAGALAAGKAALTGSDPMQAALVAAAGAGVGSTVGGMEALKNLDPAVAKALTAAASGAVRAAVGGGDPITAALSSALNVGVQSAMSASPGLTVGSVAPVTPIASTPNILAQLSAQEAEAQGLQRVLASAGVLPEQRGLLAGDYKQEGIGDVLARGAESALGALVPSAQASGKDRLVLPQPSGTEGAQPQDYKYFFDVMSKANPQSAYSGLSADEKAAVDRAGQEFQSSSQDRQLDLLTSYRTGQFAPIETPTESWIDRGMLGAQPESSMQDILDMLGQQQTQQQAMQDALAGYAKPEDVQQGILGALGRQQIDTDAAIAALERATGQKIAAGDADILARLAEQGASQSQMESALRGEIRGLGTQFNARTEESDKKLAEFAKQTGQNLSALKSQFDQAFKDAQAKGASSDAALQAAINKVATDSAASQKATTDQISKLGANVGTVEAAVGRLGATTQAQFGDVNTRINQLQQQGMTQAQATSQALRELSGGQSKLEQQLSQSTAQQQAEQRAMEAALRGEIGGLGTQFQKDLISAMERQGASQAEMEAALRGEISGVGSTFQRSLRDALAQQQASQAQTEAALRGEIGGLGTTFDKRLSDILAQQEQEQASMQTALRGYDQRILDLMAQGESEQEAMRRALEESQATTQQQIAGVQTGLGQQISGLGQSLGQALTGAVQQFGATTQGLQKQVQQTQQQAGMGNLLAMLGLMQQGKKEAPPIPLVGEIKPFEFSTDLLEGVYQPSRTGLLGANDQLLKMTRG